MLEALHENNRLSIMKTPGPDFVGDGRPQIWDHLDHLEPQLLWLLVTCKVIPSFWRLINYCCQTVKADILQMDQQHLCPCTTKRLLVQYLGHVDLPMKNGDFP